MIFLEQKQEIPWSEVVMVWRATFGHRQMEASGSIEVLAVEMARALRPWVELTHKAAAALHESGQWMNAPPSRIAVRMAVELRLVEWAEAEPYSIEPRVDFKQLHPLRSAS